MQTIAEGAEATLYRDDGTVVKVREPKRYRHEELDARLRLERTEQEARLLEKARQAGVNVPRVETRGEDELALERIDGQLLKDVIEEEQAVWPLIGAAAARLHNRDVIHGDLTTSNMILSGGDLYLIDFGLGTFSQRAEDRATDLHLLKEVMDSTHTAIADDAMDVVLTAYEDHADDAEAVLERYEEIEGRGRYK